MVDTSLAWRDRLHGFVFDPLVLQVPDDVVPMSAVTVRDGQLRTLTTTVATSFPADPDTVVTAEPGHHFVIFDSHPADEEAIRQAAPSRSPSTWPCSSRATPSPSTSSR